MYEDYYKRQTGGGADIPVFVGSRRQRGHGIGSILGGLFRRVVPFIRGNVSKIGKNVLRTGMDIASDVLSGKRFKDAAKQGVARGLKRTAGDMDWSSVHPRVRAVAPHLLTTGADIADDLIVGGKRFKETLASRVPEGIKRAAFDISRQKGGGKRRRQTTRNKTSKAQRGKRRRSVKKRRRRDIFD